jgi:hypothetical protein
VPSIIFEDWSLEDEENGEQLGDILYKLRQEGPVTAKVSAQTVLWLHQREKVSFQ